MAIIMVTHDLGVIASMCDEIIVMYGGRVCERGTADAIFYSPAHEYTKGLLRSIPTKTNSKPGLFLSEAHQSICSTCQRAVHSALAVMPL